MADVLDVLRRGIAAIGAIILVFGLAGAIVAGGWLVWLGTDWLYDYLPATEASAAALLLVALYVVIVGMIIYSLGDLRAGEGE
ncbi:hypothetical protein Halru_0301 [Halovivax ruber XH-70]|uniref:Uncharacterized protein n=1 Tax=Halovivax ruber (strain DSM 18193 / JCM 13892 / XH-70) TaxID=797302 RepID=L0I5Z3_HALRX|nr:hypothetical protein [Halovivax ruber]AGB14945.1 hypothetical protein Halru_0301 [Halovivax ruber XH-70]